MPKFRLLAATALSFVPAAAWAQTQTPAPADQGGGTPVATAPAATQPPSVDEQTTDAGAGIQDIVVTAQRQAETLQSVPIAVSAFNAEALKAQQINTTSDLQLTLPNITFTKSNFTSSSSFNIRGIGDLCVGVSCDSATAIHVNDVPILGSPIFQNEFFDVERIEVLRGPQGTLFGRNATGGVLNFITAKPDLSGFHASVDGEYGNYNSYRVKGMINVPLGDLFGVRLAGYYLKRDGFTRNLYTGNRIDGRDQFDVRGSIRFQPSSDTTIDVMGHWFREKDDRARIQKQLCHRDPTGVLGCLPDRTAFETANFNSTFIGTLSSREFISIGLSPALAGLALGSVYGTDQFSTATNPTDLRTVNLDYEPTFFTQEKQVLASLNHDFGTVNLKIDGGYTEGSTDSSSDYYLNVHDSLANNSGLATLNAAARPGLPLAAYNNMRLALIPNGTATLCQSQAESTGTGVFGGHSICAPTSLDFDRSNARSRQYTGEAILSTNFDGPFNFLLGGIYLDNKVEDNNYYVNSFGIDYVAALIGSTLSGGTSYRATPFFDSNSALFRLKSYGVFGEAYLKVAENVKLTGGIRYNHDSKNYISRSTLAAFLVPFGSANAFTAPGFASYDADPSVAGIQPFAVGKASFSKITGRAVLDWQITDRNLLYASYSRGYKSGGFNPPTQPILGVPTTFVPETVDAFEVGSKNTLLDGTLRLNLTGFYYKYKNLQLSRIVARTSVNDNINADIYGAEAEAIIKPSRTVLVNFGASYLNTKIAGDRFFSNPQDPGASRADAVVAKDLQEAYNCAITSNSGNATQSNTFVGAVNTLLGLRTPTPIPSTNYTGAFSFCTALQAAAAGNIGTFNAALAAPNPALGGLTGQQFINFQVTGNPAGNPNVAYNSTGVPVNVRGNRLPQAPTYKFSAGIQYTADAGDWSIVPRVDLTYTGGYYGSIFNKNVNRIQGYEIINAQIQVNGPDERFYVRGFIQNLTNNNAITGLYVTDQSSGLFTNAFSLEPRRYGIAAGFKF